MQNTYAIVFPFGEGTRENGVYRNAVELLRRNRLEGNASKMGPHTTFLPPFLISEGEITKQELYEMHKELVIEALTEEFKIFQKGPLIANEGHVVVSLDVPCTSKAIVEETIRTWPFPFVNPPAGGETWNPHFTLFEGHLGRASAILPKLQHYIAGRAMTLRHPTLMMKTNDPRTPWVIA